MLIDPRLRAAVADYARRLHARGWVANHDGNITTRLGENRYLATPTATSKADVQRATNDDFERSMMLTPVGDRSQTQLGRGGMRRGTHSPTANEGGRPITANAEIGAGSASRASDHSSPSPGGRAAGLRRMTRPG